MSTYNPDLWMVVKITNGEKHHYRVFGSWSGGYLHGDSWKLNSGITKATLEDGVYHFDGSSGSVYECRKNSYGATGWCWGVINNIIENSAKDGTIVEVMPEGTNFLELNYE